MVDAELRDAAHGGIDDDVGRIEPPAEADLDHAGVGGGLGKNEEGGGGGDLEEAGLEFFRLIEHARQQRG